jgi:hypothetical protein
LKKLLRCGIIKLLNYNPTSTNEKALQLLTSTNLIEEEPIQPKKNFLYDEPSTTQDEDD